MTYKETLFFVAKCLSINTEKHNLAIVENQIKNNSVDWDAVVKLSTSHYVFPALYCNLKKANLLHFLPEQLIAFMDHITYLNGERNEAILEQAKAINALLLKNNITPIFLKGVGFIAQDFYENISERMIADIDFVVSKKDYAKSISLIENFGYSKVDKNKHHSPSFKHHPRLQKEGCVAAVEIHKEILIEKFSDEFNYQIVAQNTIQKNGFTVMSFDNQLSLSILANQINDDGFYFKNLTLKAGYDVYLMAQKTNAKNAFEQFDRLKYPLNCFLASCYQAFNKIDTLAYNTDIDADKYLKYFNLYLDDNKKRKRDYKLKTLKLFLIRKKDFILKTIFHKEYRNWFINDLLIKLKLRKLAY